MYHHNNSSTDPYAGQYPPPQPVLSEERHSSSTPTYQYDNYHQQPSAAYYSIPQPALPGHINNDYYAGQPAAVGATHGNDYYAAPQPQPQPLPASSDYYTPPLAASTTDYYNQHHRSAGYDTDAYYPHPNTSYYTEEIEDTPASQKMPIIDKSKPAAEADEPSASLTASDNNNNNSSASTSSEPKRKSAGLFGMKKNKSVPVEDVEKRQFHPVAAPADEKPTYVMAPRPYEERDRTCCCYNPALTCCSVFCMLFSLAFVAAGVAMMIASKVVTDKCTNECGGVDAGNTDGSFHMPDSCTVICSDALRKGLLYGGAVVAGLAAISVIWRLVMWCCAGYSRK